MESKYHYVVFGYPRDYFRVMFQDAIDKMGVEYIDDPIVYGGYNKLLVGLYHLHNNPYLNWRWQLPFNNIWFDKFYDKKEQGKPFCFVFMMDWVKPKFRGLLDVLRNKYPNAKFVVYLEDLVSRHNFDVEEAQKFDLCISYDLGDSKCYGFEYCPTFLSKVSMTPSKYTTDCSFVGLPKNRLDIINELYQKLSNSGLVCDFVISSLKDDNKKIAGVNYIKNDLPYLEYLNHVNSTNCMIEVMQNNCTGYTLRTWEALLYGKKLLTNNPEILRAPFYNERQFIYFDDPSAIEIEKIRERVEIPPFDSRSISSICLFELIEKMLNI